MGVSQMDNLLRYRDLWIYDRTRRCIVRIRVQGGGLESGSIAAAMGDVVVFE